MNKGILLVVGGVVAGAVATVAILQNREKFKPAAAQVVAKALRLKEKALDYAVQTKEHAEDILAEARHINASPRDVSPDKA